MLTPIPIQQSGPIVTWPDAHPWSWIGEPRSISWFAVWIIVYGPKIDRSPMVSPPYPLT